MGFGVFLIFVQINNQKPDITETKPHTCCVLQVRQKVYLERDSPGTKISLTSDPGPIRLDIFHIYKYMTLGSLSAVTAATLIEPKERKKTSVFGFKLIIC